MPEYLAPGVYIEEISTRPRPIEGVGTSTAAMLGQTERGPEYPVLLTSWLEYQRWYGTYVPQQSYLAYAVQGFFDNGGKRCFVARITGEGSAPATLTRGNLQLFAVGGGTWGNRVRVRISRGGQAEDDQGLFRVSVIYYRDEPATFVDPLDSTLVTDPNREEPDHVEVFDNLTFEDGASNNVLTAVNAGSQLVRCLWVDPSQPARPDNADFAPLENGDDGAAVTVARYDGDVDSNFGPIGGQEPPLDEPLGAGRGLAALASIDDVNILLAPDEVRPGLGDVTTSVINQCLALKDRFAVVSVSRGQSSVNNLRPPQDTSFAAFYYPWIEVFDPYHNRPQLVPPSGHVAGIYARTDIERGVHKAPANEVVRGARRLEFPVTKGMQDLLNPRGVNCIRDFRASGEGIRLWGARTMASDPEWKYVNVRRLFLYIEESVEESTQWVVFEPNYEPTWAKVVRSITAFLVTVWKNGALEGLTQDEAFFVKCDRTTMTEDDIQNGRLICYVGVAPTMPAEFVIFRFTQKTREAKSI